MPDIVRTAVKIKRTPITFLSDNPKYFKSAFGFRFENPEGTTPLADAVTTRITKVRDLWCPYCARKTKFKVRSDETDVWDCKGGCGVGHTNDWYVKYTNNLWWDGVPFEKVKELTRIRWN